MKAYYMSTQPWECTRCHKINAPWLPFCHCQPKEKTEIEKTRDIIGEKWVLMFTNDKGEVLQGIVGHHERLPEAIKNVLSADGRNIYLEDRTPWRLEENENSANKQHVREHGYNPKWVGHCPACHEMLNGLTIHKCKLSKHE